MKLPIESGYSPSGEMIWCLPELSSEMAQPELAPLLIELYTQKQGHMAKKRGQTDRGGHFY